MLLLPPLLPNGGRAGKPRSSATAWSGSNRSRCRLLDPLDPQDWPFAAALPSTGCCAWCPSRSPPPSQQVSCLTRVGAYSMTYKRIEAIWRRRARPFSLAARTRLSTKQARVLSFSLGSRRVNKACFHHNPLSRGLVVHILPAATTTITTITAITTTTTTTVALVLIEWKDDGLGELVISTVRHVGHCGTRCTWIRGLGVIVSAAQAKARVQEQEGLRLRVGDGWCVSVFGEVVPRMV